MCYCKWKDNQIINVNVDVKLKGEVTKKITVNERIKTLGVHVNPKLEWEYQYEHVIKKMQVTIRKL